MFRLISACFLLSLGLSGCGREDHIGRAPSFTPSMSNTEHMAMLSPGLPLTAENTAPLQQASLWNGGRNSLLGDRRAMQRGDILTVVVEIDDEAEISNTSARSRNGAESLGMPQLFGLPQRLDDRLSIGIEV